MITILHHLGLGDAIMLNGMVRHFAEMEEVCIFVQKQHLVSVEFMYRDIKDRVKIKTVNTTNAQDMWSQVEGKVLPLATYRIPDNIWKYIMEGPPTEMVNWAHSVYIQAGIPPKYMYSKFKVVRDKPSEIKCEYDDYVFIHDDISRGLKIESDHPNVFRITPEVLEKNSNIFEYLTVIENAKEVHCMDSCYAWMINMMEIGNASKNFLHLDVKGNYNTNMVRTVFGDDVWTCITSQSIL
jgi:hypothetical protein|tara:strand:- start:11171 stop:11887 length:717 start_codon:yes stop_codon:yes gene_type:complete